MWISYRYDLTLSEKRCERVCSWCGCANLKGFKLNNPKTFSLKNFILSAFIYEVEDVITKLLVWANLNFHRHKIISSQWICCEINATLWWYFCHPLNFPLQTTHSAHLSATSVSILWYQLVVFKLLKASELVVTATWGERPWLVQSQRLYVRTYMDNSGDYIFVVKGLDLVCDCHCSIQQKKYTFIR